MHHKFLVAWIVGPLVPHEVLFGNIGPIVEQVVRWQHIILEWTIRVVPPVCRHIKLVDQVIQRRGREVSRLVRKALKGEEQAPL